MPRTISIGAQDYASLIENDYFYIDKTSFIRDWWCGGDVVTLITRPRRFGKTLNMSMLDYFFSNKYEGRSDLFEGLDIWKDEKFRELQGTYPVIFLSFAGVKQDTYEKTKEVINEIIANLYNNYESIIMNDDRFTSKDRAYFNKVGADMKDSEASLSLKILCDWLYRYYGKKCIVLLDEYDTPLQEAYIHGFWDELVTYTRALFNNTFKTNPSMERAIMTGITRVSKESIFSDLNNLEVVTTTSGKYATVFGFTEEEVFKAIEEQGYGDDIKKDVKFWYDGFIFGTHADIYNPWSITHFLKSGIFDTHWANTSGNGLVGHLIQNGNPDIKMDFEKLIKGEYIDAAIDEQIVFNQLDDDIDAVWSLLLASGYLKCEKIIREVLEDTPIYRLVLTNFEVKKMFEKMVIGWFKKGDYFNGFVRSMFSGDLRGMNQYMNKVALNTFSYFDAGKKPSDESEPEKFYHGFVLGLLVDNAKSYTVKSNRESGFGRYDVVLEPHNKNDVAVIMEFKVYDNEYDGENDLSDTADNALAQIEEKKYEADLIASGIPEDRILKYGFAFQGKKCLIKKKM